MHTGSGLTLAFDAGTTPLMEVVLMLLVIVRVQAMALLQKGQTRQAVQEGQVFCWGSQHTCG